MFKEWKHSEFQLEDEWYYIPMLLWNFFKYILNTNNRRDVALPTRTIVSRRPTRPASPLFFLSCFLLYNLSGVSRFLLLFTFLWFEILSIWPVSLHSRVLVFVSFCFVVCVCAWGVGGVCRSLLLWQLKQFLQAFRCKEKISGKSDRNLRKMAKGRLYVLVDKQIQNRSCDEVKRIKR